MFFVLSNPAICVKETSDTGFMCLEVANSPPKAPTCVKRGNQLCVLMGLSDNVA